MGAKDEVTRDDLTIRNWWRELLERGPLVFHAGGVSDGSRAILFPGKSGSGKTTVVNEMINKGYLPLGDELILVYSEGSKLLVSPIEAFSKNKYNKVEPKIFRAELIGIIILLPDGNGVIRTYNMHRDGLFFTFSRESVRTAQAWRNILYTIFLILSKPIYVAHRPKLPVLLKFADKLFQDCKLS